MSDFKGTCPYCNNVTYADSVDVGVGFVQCGPYYCESCGASEIGPELYDWCYQDRSGNTIYLLGKRKYREWFKNKVQFGEKYILKPGHPFTKKELETGYYQGQISPYANTVGGMLVDHITAKEAYNVGMLDEKHLT